MTTFQPQNRAEIRQSIGFNLDALILSEATTNGTNATLIDTYTLANGYTDEYRGRQVHLYSPVGAITVGSKGIVTAFNATTKQLTFVPTMNSTTADGDLYELWKGYMVEAINDFIKQAISHVSAVLPIPKADTSLIVFDENYEYSIPDGFTAIHEVEYGKATDALTVSLGDVVWDELVDADVLASIDTTIFPGGASAVKLAVATLCGAGDILATDQISVDLRAYDQITVQVYSTVALVAGDIQLLLDNSTLCGSPLETLNLPAVAANTLTNCTLSLSNPYNLSAIISVGFKMVVDKGAFNFYFRLIEGVVGATYKYETLNPKFWGIVPQRNKLKLTETGISVAGDGATLRLSGYALPALFSDDTTDSEIDPQYLIDAVTGEILLSHYKGELDTEARMQRASTYIAKAQARLKKMATTYRANTRFV